MRHIKPFLVTFTALVLICSIPLSASGFSISDEDMQTYRPVDRVSGNSLGEFPAVGVWYQFNGSDYSACGVFDSGMPTYAFIIWVPLKGYYLVSVQSMDMQYQLRGHVTANGNDFYIYGTLYIEKNTNGDYTNSYYQWRGNGGYALEYDSVRHFQTSFLGNYLVFHRIYTKSSNGTPQRSSYESFQVPKYETPQQNLKDQIQSIINSYFGNNGNVEYPTGGSSSTVPTLPNGNPVPTDANGRPVPTDANGRPVTTNSSGNTIPTYPDGRPRETFPNGEPVPTDSAGRPLPTFTTPDGSTYVDPEGYTHVTDPDNGEPVTDASSHTPIYEEVTIYNDENGKSDVSKEFSKIHSMVADLDNLSSIMESNQGDLSGIVDNTRGLVDDILGWFPAPIIACLACGAIMIIAVKITGSGKS